MSLSVLDWRRRVAELYRDVRRESSPERGHEIWRKGRDSLFLEHPASPLLAQAKAGFGGLSYGTYDRSLRFEIEVSDAEPGSYSSETATDGTVRFERVGTVELKALGRLDVWWLLGYGGGIFVPLADPSPTSYHGGRYVLDTVKGADLGGDFDADSGRGTLVVDLNFAYNPSCAYDPSWACPLAPAGNRLETPIMAGEQRFSG